MLGVELTRWTIRLALLCLAGRFTGDLMLQGSPAWFRWSRIFSTAGCLLFLAHVASAFHFYHQWSHARAFEVTAAETEAMLGVRFGEGIYFSYLFALVWALDVIWQWLVAESYRRRPAWLGIAISLYLAFIALNGAIVFEAGVTRVVGIPVVLALSVVACVAARRAILRSGTSRPAESVPSLANEEA